MDYLSSNTIVALVLWFPEVLTIINTCPLSCHHSAESCVSTAVSSSRVGDQGNVQCVKGRYNLLSLYCDKISADPITFEHTDPTQFCTVYQLPVSYESLT